MWIFPCSCHYVVIILNLCSSHCPTVCSYLWYWDHLTVHLFLHSNTTAHSIIHLFYFCALCCTERRLLTHSLSQLIDCINQMNTNWLRGLLTDWLTVSLQTYLTCSALHWTVLNWALARTLQLFYRRITLQEVSYLVSSQVTVAYGITWTASEQSRYYKRYMQARVCVLPCI
jgi:hypothetical protein